MTREDENSINDLYFLYKFNLFYHFIGIILIPIACMYFFPLITVVFYPILFLAFIGPVLSMVTSLVLIIHFILNGDYSETAFLIDNIAMFVSTSVIIVSYVLYKRALTHKKYWKLLIILPVLWTYPIPIMIYTVLVHYSMFLQVIMGKTIFNSYHFPGVIKGIMSVINYRIIHFNRVFSFKYPYAFETLQTPEP